MDLAGGGQSTSKFTCEVPAGTLTAFGDRSASSMSKIEAGLNSDPGNDSFWDKIRDAKHVDRSTHQYMYYPGQKKTATTIMHKIRTLFLSWDIEKSSLIALRCAVTREVAAGRATVCQSPDHADHADIA